jgi:hypothetical protein
MPRALVADEAAIFGIVGSEVGIAIGVVLDVFEIVLGVVREIVLGFVPDVFGFVFRVVLRVALGDGLVGFDVCAVKFSSVGKSVTTGAPSSVIFVEPEFSGVLESMTTQSWWIAFTKTSSRLSLPKPR